MKHDFKTLRLERVTRNFGGPPSASGAAPLPALGGLTMNIARGEFIALLGPSGCGKSTALNCLSGLLALSSGAIYLDQLRIDTLPPEQRGFGMVFQNYALFPHMTVAKNVGFGLLMRNVSASEIEVRVKRALDLVQLGMHAGKLPGQLSGGQQQRVAIARAIVIEPPLILMDEPLSNLDAKLRLEMRSEIRRIHGELGRTTIYVTHDQDEALSLADRIVVMKDGLVQQVGTPQEVYAQPANLSVARFMGYRNELLLDVAHKSSGSIHLTGPGIELHGVPQHGIGARAAVSIRPEEFSICAPGQQAANSITARVEAVEYYGRESLFMLRTQDSTRLFVRTEGTAQPGDNMTVSVPPERVLAYPSEQVA
ncbi:ABC transporter ATP-binding protein [Janthinobacterium sp. HLX7-2]|uniref:ABC transporter ATP-binding protein n=1 Tax=Janthinobacterium sp. HLX7-2 TaxID=1259331 RepID=UPI003F245E86